MTDRPARAPRAVVRGALVALAAVALLAALYTLAAVRPTPNSLYPKCVSYRLTGTHCPGCGTARALHFALNGDIARALRANALAFVLLPVVAVAVGRSLWRWAADRPEPERLLGARWIRLLLVVLITFWVARNIPAYPFTLLAPVELPDDEPPTRTGSR